LEEKLCSLGDKGYGYYITELKIMEPDGRVRIITPFFEKTEGETGFYYIEGGINKQGIEVLSPQDRLIGIEPKLKYSWQAKIFSIIPVIGKVDTAFRLPADLSKNAFSTKPLYLIAPFYLFYIVTLLLIIYMVTFLIYRYTIKNQIRLFFKADKHVIRNKKILSKISEVVLLFPNALSLIVVFLLANRLIQRLIPNEWFWLNEPFYKNLFFYSIIQVIIVLMFSDSYKMEINLHARKILNSQEFNYLRLIGMNHKQQYGIYRQKYGKMFFRKIFIQNIFFVTNINFFITYAFNVWKKITDSIGLTYAISFENILTKIVHERGDRADAYNYVILILFYAVLFAYYMYLQKKSEVES
jgi:hypothetical protein